MSLPKILEKKLSRPVAVMGSGVSGNAVKKFLQGIGVSAVIYDKSGVAGTVSEFNEDTAKQHDLCVFSPGFPLSHTWLGTARAAGVLCLTEIDFAAVFFQGAVAPMKRMRNEKIDAFLSRVGSRFNLVAVTGTNGKTTLTEFLSFAHRKAGRGSAAVGNNGIPMTTILDAEPSGALFPICEVSSFQAEALHYFSPRAVLWTNFDEDHIDRHGSLENYFRAKFRLIELQLSLRLVVGDFPERNSALETLLSRRICVVGESVAAAAKKFGIELPPWVEVATREEVKNCIPQETIFETFPQMENYAVARRYWLAAGFPIEALESAALAFKPCAHRLEKVAAIGEAPAIEFWNDSKGTNFHSVYAALETFSGVPVYWIGGGRGKGGDIHFFVNKISRHIKKACLIGETAKELEHEFLEKNVTCEVCETLQSAVLSSLKAVQKAERNRAVILLSPGFASFDMFKGYSERGIQFVSIVNNIISKV